MVVPSRGQIGAVLVVAVFALIEGERGAGIDAVGHLPLGQELHAIGPSLCRGHQGFVAEDAKTKPMTTLPALFAGAFLANHRYVKDDVIDAIYAKMPNKGELIGKLAEVLDYPGNKVYVVKGEKEYMIPAVKAFVLDTDMENNRMQVKLIEGMRSDEN